MNTQRGLKRYVSTSCPFYWLTVLWKCILQAHCALKVYFTGSLCSDSIFYWQTVLWKCILLAHCALKVYFTGTLCSGSVFYWLTVLWKCIILAHCALEVYFTGSLCSVSMCECAESGGSGAIYKVAYLIGK